jgi:ATP-dependent DNA helicase RecG
MLQTEPIRYLKGIGPKKEIVFNDLGVHTVKDLLYYFPFRYEDRTNFKSIKDLKAGELALVKGKVLLKRLKKIPYYFRAKKVRDIFEVVLSDSSALADCLWFNQGFLDESVKIGSELFIYGKVGLEAGKFKFISPQYELLGSDEKEENDTSSLNFGRIVGMYRLSSVFTQKFMRKTIFSMLYQCREEIAESLPFYVRQEKNLPNIVKSLEQIHFPASFLEAEKARERFIFEELFFSQILVYLRKAKHRRQLAQAFEINQDLMSKMRSNLTFQLTVSQETALSQIFNDIVKPCPMHRLLQGDVGCGKTAVASFALAACAANSFQAALMVPTEVLAYQHKQSLEEIFQGFNFKIEVLVSSLPQSQAERVRKSLAEGKTDIVIGTHSLIQEEVIFNKLALVIIDEQHKFGVAQRALLPKKGRNPHCLVMSATPIPRSLALSLYGDLDFSVIKELPKGRILAETRWVSLKQREEVYAFLAEKLKDGRQAYIIYPVIEESEDEDLKSLEEMYGKIRQFFSSFKVGMFHGKMKPDKKTAIVESFRKKEINILVATTILEVGVNVENATVMVVENPERFGLSQLHQLRGRIQRYTYQPYFILLGKEELSPLALKRLEVISATNDGFKIAEEDLKLRGPGDFFGEMQHGLPDLKIANPLKDLEILSHARQYAYKIIKSDPHLQAPQHKCIREHLHYWFGDKIAEVRCQRTEVR